MAGTQVRSRFFSWGQSLGQLETQSRDLQRLPWNDQRGPFVSCVFPRLVGFGDPPQPALPVCFPDRSPCLIQDSKVTELIHSPVLVSFYCCDKIPQEQQPRERKSCQFQTQPSEASSPNSSTTVLKHPHRLEAKCSDMGACGGYWTFGPPCQWPG